MSWLTGEAALQNKLVNGKEVIDAQICLQTIIFWTPQDGSVQICFGSISAQRLTSKVCLDLSRSGSLTGVRLFSRPRAPALYLTRPNCVLCSSCWLSSLFDIQRRKLLAWRAVSSLRFSSLTCQRAVLSLFGAMSFQNVLLFVPSDDLIDWLNAAIGLIMFSWEWKKERSVLSARTTDSEFYFFIIFFISARVHQLLPLCLSKALKYTFGCVVALYKQLIVHW